MRMIHVRLELTVTRQIVSLVKSHSTHVCLQFVVENVSAVKAQTTLTSNTFIS